MTLQHGLAHARHDPRPSALPRNRSRYQNTAVSMMRNAVLDAMQRMLLERKWSSITMAGIAAAAGISRGTLYNEFGSRIGLARKYALRLTDAIIVGLEKAIEARPGDGYHTLYLTFTEFFNHVDNDPLVRVLRNEDAPNDLLRMITVESQFILDYAGEQLAEIFQRSWVRANADDAAMMARAIARAALSFLALPPDNSADAAVEIARVFAPCIDVIAEAS
ncbi:TetR family transcriptional regulator [Mycobacterium intermedium]|uniref:TetR family transcriptional regulator n=1 Tax=Mycobacterium intermedium TaxID=28445 RepID=A0A1E3SA23_MYCIE|nr:TetR family transcriptional regulator [Mycobacterium intermedium]MCV6964281.1 TetR family transcriptional regulator [Mycobacterium intermedium]ODQ98996.1 TetR family transcriptional regulator [Mycobacterium intermedium]OPE48472.1 TetR family transcriptional regulator [Mycobacterium intermedium]ORB05337.1 TetR family transcriptional regulator [Mycobacterium intermedium]